MSTTATPGSVPVTEANDVEKKNYPKQTWLATVAIFLAILGILRAVVSGCLAQNEEHAAERTSNMATYVLTSGWSLFIATCVFHAAPSFSLWLIGGIAFIQIAAGILMSFWASRKRNATNDGDLD